MKRENLRQRGVALLPTMILLTFIATMIAVALQENISQRKFLKGQKDSLDALYLAESGAQEALHRMTTDPKQGSVARDVDRGAFDAQWSASPMGVKITSVGIARKNAPEVTRRTIVVDVVGRGGEEKMANWRAE